jgi:ribonuclease P protein component
MPQQLDNAENTKTNSQSLKADLQTLTKRQDFILASRGLKHSCDTMIVQTKKNDLRTVRVGITCSKKVGNAVVRNRAKRRLRAIAREIDYVLIGRHGSTISSEFKNLKNDFISALEALHRKSDGEN